MSENEQNDCTPPPAGTFGWNELMATDTNDAAKFYGDVFGWSTEPFSGAGGMPYTIFKQEGAPMGVGGMLKNPMPDVPAQWVPYVAVDDVDASQSKARAAGAVVLVPATDIDMVGRIAVLRDPQGAIFGLHQMPRT